MARLPAAWMTSTNFRCHGRTYLRISAADIISWVLKPQSSLTMTAPTQEAAATIE